MTALQNDQGSRLTAAALHDHANYSQSVM